MGKVALKLKLLPSDIEQYETMKRNVLAAVTPAQTAEVPIAFGLKAFVITLVLEDKDGSGDIEEKLRTIDGVGAVEVEAVTLIET